jgi:hypothetical protein
VLHECDSLVAINAFANINVVPWTLRNQWYNCLLLGLSVTSSHIYWEGNKCADRFENHGHMLTNSLWWYSMPRFITVGTKLVCTITSKKFMITKY